MPRACHSLVLNLGQLHAGDRRQQRNPDSRWLRGYSQLEQRKHRGQHRCHPNAGHSDLLGYLYDRPGLFHHRFDCCEHGKPPNLVVTSATICAGSSATLTAAGCAGTVSWSNGTSGNTLVTPTLTQTTNYTATCTTTTSTTFAVGTVTVNPAVTATISAGNLSICVGQTTTLTASGGATYRWSTGATTAAISVSAAGTYSVTATSAAGCSGTATVTVVQNPTPTVIATSATICAGSSATLTASGANSYLWSNGASTASIVVSPTATTTYSVTGTSSAGCSATATGTLTVLPQPVLNLSASSTLVTVGNNVTPDSLRVVRGR